MRRNGRMFQHRGRDSHANGCNLPVGFQIAYGPNFRDLEELLRIQQNRYRPAVHQLHIHHGLEASGLAAQSAGSHPVDEIFIQLSRALRAAPPRRMTAACLDAHRQIG